MLCLILLAISLSDCLALLSSSTRIFLPFKSKLTILDYNNKINIKILILTKRPIKSLNSQITGNIYGGAFMDSFEYELGTSLKNIVKKAQKARKPMRYASSTDKTIWKLE